MTANELFDIGLGYERLGKMDHALRSYARIVVLWPGEIAPYHRLSILALQNGDAAQALAWIDKGMGINDSLVDLWNNRALALAELKRYDEAHRAFDRAISLNANNWDAFYNLGRMLLLQKRFREAEPILRQAAELDPNSARTFNNLGLVLHELYEYDAACAAFDRAIEIHPGYIEARSNKGASLYHAHKYSEANEQWQETIALAPEEAGVHYNLASLLMAQGDLLEGFEEYEWRWKTKDWPTIRKYHGRPIWKGQRLSGETILVWHEQGLGDTLHFVRLVNELAKQNCEIVLEVQNELHRLLVASSSLPNVRFIRTGVTPPTFDVHVPLMSLPHLLGTSYETLPQFKPYVRPRGKEIEEWRGKLKTMTPLEHRKKRRIGIVWAGNPAHPGDHNRSMTWAAIAPLIPTHKDRFQFFSLQAGMPTEHPDVIDLGNALKDFAVTAAIVSNLDLVIAVDTSVVHLAGALGKRVWVMLSHTPDWRWVIGQERTQWYPSTSLFWQKKPGEWNDVIAEVSEMLALE